MKYLWQKIWMLCLMVITANFDTHAQTSDSSKTVIKWKQHNQLLAEDFKKVFPDSLKDRYYARSFIYLEKKIELLQNSIQYRVEPVFFSNESYFQSTDTFTDSLTLVHESLHFAICEIAARRIRKYLQSFSVMNRNLVSEDEISTMIEKICLFSEYLDGDLDIDNEMYFNEAAVKKWKPIIDAELNRLAEFSEPSGTIEFLKK